MRFTQHQYDVAIQSLMDARCQLEPDGRNCACCGDSGHQAFECGHNPLLAMAMCKGISAEAQRLHDALHAGQLHAEKLHEFIHYLAGHESRMGHMQGPTAIHCPPEEVPEKVAAPVVVEHQVAAAPISDDAYALLLSEVERYEAQYKGTVPHNKSSLIAKIQQLRGLR